VQVDSAGGAWYRRRHLETGCMGFREFTRSDREARALLTSTLPPHFPPSPSSCGQTVAWHGTGVPHVLTCPTWRAQTCTLDAAQRTVHVGTSFSTPDLHAKRVQQTLYATKTQH